MNSTRRARKPLSDINVVPYIDVMLVLLIIFMVTAPMMMQGVEVNVPNLDAGVLQPEDDQEYLIIAVNAQGQIYIERGEEEPLLVASEAVADYVTRVLRQQPLLQVFIRGDTQVGYGTVMAVMGALQNSGIESVGLITESQDDN